MTVFREHFYTFLAEIHFQWIFSLKKIVDE